MNNNFSVNDMETNKQSLPVYVDYVINPYDTSDSKNRPGVLVNGPWQDSITKYIRDNNIKALYINSSKGWRGDDFSFLKALDTIEELDIICSSATNLNAIEKMSSLVELSITTTTKDRVDFSQLLNLKKCYLYWWTGAQSIFYCSSLEELYLDKLKLKDYSKLSSLKNLKALTIANSTIDQADWLTSLTNLISLSFLNCRKFNDFAYIAQSTQLNKLVFDGCKLVDDLNFAASLTELEVLITADCGEIDSIRALEHLQKLKAYSFSGNTNIQNGDLSVLTELPELAMLMFQSRRHYSHKLIKKWDWSNFNQPDVLLQSK